MEMFSSRSTEHLAFVSRQLARLLESQPLPAAFKKLEDASPVEYAGDIEYLRQLLEGENPERRRLGPDPYRAIQKLLPPVGDSRETLFREFVAYIRQSRIVFETYWSGVIGLIWYLAAVASVALVVSVIFANSVIPSFDDMFTQFGSGLPAFTEIIFSLGYTGIPAFAALLAATVAIVVFCVWLFHRRIQQMAPLPRWPRWVPILGRIAETYNFGLFLNYTRILRSCGVESQTAVDKAAAITNQSARLSLDALSDSPSSHGQFPALTELGIATRLGQFDAEVSHQCEQHLGELTLALVETRDRFSVILKLALYLFIGTLVVAMYLPIFKMGTVV